MNFFGGKKTNSIHSSRTYTTRKALFEHEQLVEYFQKKKKFDEDLREELKAAFNDVGYLPDDRFSSDSDDDEHEVNLNPCFTRPTSNILVN